MSWIESSPPDKPLLTHFNSMNPETLRKEFEEKFGLLEGPDLNPNSVGSKCLFSWFLSKLSKAQAEAREEVIEEINKSLHEMQNKATVERRQYIDGDKTYHYLCGYESALNDVHRLLTNSK